MNDNDITLFNLRSGLLQVLRGDNPPLAFRDIYYDTCPIVLVQRNLIGKFRALYDVSRRIRVGRTVHGGGDDLREHAGLGVIMNPLDFDVGEIGPQGALVSERLT